MLRRLVRKIITAMKGRSASQISKSELDNFIDSFENSRQEEPQSRKHEREKHQTLSEKRDFFK